MGRPAQRHVRGMPRTWRSLEWRRKQPGYSLAQPPNCSGRRDHLRASHHRWVRTDAGRPEEPAAMVRAGWGGDRHLCMGDPARPRRARGCAGELAMARAYGGAALDLPRWEAGQRMMQSASPTAFRAIVGADRVVTANREAIEGCSKAAARRRETARCTIKVEVAVASHDVQAAR